jgi:hypothetical protein
MSQRKNAVILTNTAISRLQVLVDSGEYCTLDDAASHVITSVLGSTPKYSPVLSKTEPVLADLVPLTPSTTPVLGGKKPKHTAFFDD